MGTFLFRWPHPDASDVHVTGTFDDWGKSEQLNKVGDVWEKEVELPSADEKILYKFVVDDKWVTDHTAPQEDDGHFNVNNVLYPQDIKKKTTSTGASAGAAAAAPVISSAAPGTTSSDLAGKEPLTAAGEESRSAVPGAFPETPANEPEAFSVKPIPASSGTGNPINLPAGDEVPAHSDVTPHTVDSTVTTSKEDYENAGSSALPLVGGAAAGVGVGAGAASAFSRHEDKQNLIPESSLPMEQGPSDATDVGPTTSSAAPTSTTSGLAGGVPLEKKRQAMVVDPADAPSVSEATSSVPEPVKQSMAESQQAPEAAASEGAVKEKSAVEKELLSKTTTSEATNDGSNTAAAQTSYYGLATSVPRPVEESMAEAQASPEAASQPSVVAEKTAFEKELLQKVPSTDKAGEPAPSMTAATSATAPTTSGVGAGTVATGAAAGTAAVAGTAAAVTGDKDASIPKTDGAADTGVPGTLGSSSSAAAAVADGTDGAETPVRATPKTTIPVEKTEADGTEYAPPRDSAATPGVSKSAAAAISDGAEDPTLADEPAVRMMNQNEAPPATEPAVIPATSAPTATAGTTATAAKKEGSAPGKVLGSAAAATGESATSTPSKKVTPAPATSSPATSSTKEQKKKHRVSSFFKKIFE